MRNKKEILLVTIINLLLILNIADAKVTGPCYNCHTMHNSQGGEPVDPNNPDAKVNLLIKNCIGCHTGVNDGTNTIPYVNSPVPPEFGVNTLAGGNFYWVREVSDSKGHNVFLNNSDENFKGLDTLGAPGNDNAKSCLGLGENICHFNLDRPVSGLKGNLNGRQGCTKCHMVTNTDFPKGFHHRNDGDQSQPWRYVNNASEGWYRFLAGHDKGDGYGVIGIEHKYWNYQATKELHNEYTGNYSPDLNGFDGEIRNCTTTAFCCGCHNKFHRDMREGADYITANPWIRHPSDVVIPNEREYAALHGADYNPQVPVARASSFFPLQSPLPDINLEGGRDMVMCLSCHVAHGSPYDDLLRWDYQTMIAGRGGSGGCFTCHTQK